LPAEGFLSSQERPVEVMRSPLLSTKRLRRIRNFQREWNPHPHPPVMRERELALGKVVKEKIDKLTRRGKAGILPAP
jgi:hypothetical protein